MTLTAMDAKHFFDAEKYFSGLCASNRLCSLHGFRFCTCSGIETLQGPLERFRDTGAFFCVDDTNDGAMFQGRSGGWYKKRTFTVFVMHRYDSRAEGDRAEKLALCRDIFRQMMSRMVVEADDLRNELVYLHTETVLSRELGQYFLNGCTGLYFMVDVSEPVDLVFDAGEWTDCNA